MYRGYVAKRATKSGHSWQIVIDCGKNEVTGKRERIIKTVPGDKHEAVKVMFHIIKALKAGVNFKERKVSIIDYLGKWVFQLK